MRRFLLIIAVAICGWITDPARGETFKLATGQEIVGEVLPTSAKDAFIMIKVGEGSYTEVYWTNFSQEALKKLAENAKLQPFVEPFIEITREEKIKRTEVRIKEPTRLERPAPRSLMGAMFATPLGLFILLLVYGANIYAGFEVAIFRAQPTMLVAGLSAIPILGFAAPIAFLAMPTKLKATEPAVEVAPAEGADAAGAATAAPVAGANTGTDPLNPMAAEGVEHPASLHLAHSDTDKTTPTIPKPITYQRGQFTFNRRFLETKFAGFFGVVRREADKDMVLVIKSSRGEYVGERISRIAANDLHLQVHKGHATEEVMIPFQEIQQIVLKHKDAK